MLTTHAQNLLTVIVVLLLLSGFVYCEYMPPENRIRELEQRIEVLQQAQEVCNENAKRKQLEDSKRIQELESRLMDKYDKCYCSVEYIDRAVGIRHKR